MSDEAFEEMAAGRLPAFYSRKDPGLIELHRLSGLLAVSASAVGGGSLVYTAVTLPAPREIFGNGWPIGVGHDTLSPYYARVAEMIRPTEIPLPLSRTSALETIAGRLGGCVSRLPLAMNWPKDGTSLHDRHSTDSVSAELVAWLRGGPAASKRTLAQTYLPQAEAAGAEIRPLHEVQAVVPEGGAYRVKYRCLKEGEWHEGSIVSRRVVLAAGTLGTTRLLLECRDVLQTLPNLSAALGHRFYTNGDFGGLLIGPTPAPVLDGGPPVTAWIDLWEKLRLFIMETGVVPYDTGSLAGLLNPAKWLGGMRMKPAKQCVWSFGVMGFEENPGMLRLGRRGKLIHRREAGISEEYRRRMTSVLEDLAAAAGAKLVRPPAIIARLLPITVHPLGGVTMADSPDAGVVDPRGEVFGHPGLYVADGSIVPTPTGVPPSMTIAALAERIVESMVEQ